MEQSVGTSVAREKRSGAGGGVWCCSELCGVLRGSYCHVACCVGSCSSQAASPFWHASTENELLARDATNQSLACVSLVFIHVID
jgi:hypothetical protein